MKKYKTIALALATLFLAGCATNTAKPSPTSAATTSGAYTTPSVAQMTTTAQIPITSEPVVTTADLVVTTASEDLPNTSEESMITDKSSQTDAPSETITQAPTTTTVPQATTTKVPTTTKTPTNTTTNAPVVTPVTTTKAPTTTTKTPTTSKVPVTTTTKAPTTTTTKATTTTKVPTTTTTKTPTTTKVPVTAAPHTHSYGPWTTTKAATCTATGTQIRTCSCGVSETKTISAIGHNWSPWTVTKAATESAKGEEVRSCSVCGKKETRSIDKLAHAHSYGEWTLCDDYIKESRSCSCGKTETQTHYATPEDARLIADRVIYYVNKYRAEEGNVIATKLDRLTLVAEMRSEQLTTNYAHDTEDSREAYGYYEYGDHIVTEETRLDPETFEIIYTGNILDYYRPVGQEAINASYGYTLQTIDFIAKATVDSLRNSPGHWAYVGAVSGHYTTYNYIAVGIAYCASNEYAGVTYRNNWFCCVLVSDTNQYE